MMKFRTIALAAVVSAVAAAPAAAEESRYSRWNGLDEQGEARYGEWRSDDQRLEKLIKEIEALLKKGSEARAADPTFLLDLQRTVERYKRPLRTVHFKESFDDGELTREPAWRIRAGGSAFKVDRDGVLRTRIERAAQAPAEPEREESAKERNMRLLLGILEEAMNEGDGADEGAAEPAANETPKRGVISAEAKIPNTFDLGFRFSVHEAWGAVSIALYQGGQLNTGYRLVYYADPKVKRPLRLMKLVGGKLQPVADSGANGPQLSDGRAHRLSWARAYDGTMRVSVDGKEVINARDTAYRDEFNGLAIINDRGEYHFDDIEVFTER